MKTLLYIILLFTSIQLWSQNPAKVYKNFEKKEYLKAEESFLKIFSKDTANCSASFGLAYLYSLPEFENTDYFKAWDYFRIARRNMDNLTEDDNQALKLHFANVDSRRRSKTIAKNFVIEESIIQDKLITYVREENNTDIAVRFIQEYSTSKYYNNVIHIRNYIEFRKAENTNTVEAFNSFIKDFPNSAQIEIATKIRNRLAFGIAKKTNTLESIKSFVKNYPDAEQIFSAEGMLNELAFQDAKSKNTLIAIESFIKEHENAKQIGKAKIIKRQLLFEEAQRVNTLEAYNNFVKEYPEGKQFVDIYNLKAKVLGNAIKDKNKINNDKSLFYNGYDRFTSDDELTSFYSNEQFSIIAGNTFIKDESSWNAYVLKVDLNGKMIWNKSIGKDFNDKINCLTLDKSNNIYVGGYMNALGDSIPGRSWIVKINDKGKVLWSKNIKGTSITTISCDADNNIIAGGYKIDTTSTIPQLFKINANGENIWKREYLTSGKIEHITVIADTNIAFVCNNWFVNLSKAGYINYEKILDTTFNVTDISFLDNLIVTSLTNRENNTQKIIAYNAENFSVKWEQSFSFSNCKNIQTQIINNELYALCTDVNSAALRILNFNDKSVKSETIFEISTLENLKIFVTPQNYFIGGTATNFGQKDIWFSKYNK